MKKLIFITLLATVAWAVDFSSYSTEELISMRGSVPVDQRADFRAEMQKRIPNMTPAQRALFAQSKNSRRGMGQGMGTRRGAGRGMGLNPNCPNR